MAELDVTALYHRTLGGNLAKLPYVDYEVRKDVFEKAARETGITIGTAYTIRDRRLVPILYVLKKDQDFKSFATSWEILHSKLPFGAGSGKCDPVVDENMTVVAYLGWFPGEDIFAPTPPRGPQISRLSDALSAGAEVHADSYNEIYLKQGYMRYSQLAPQISLLLVTDPEGRALFVAGHHDRDALEPSWVTPLDILSIGKLVLLAATALGALGIRMLARKVAIRLLRGGTRELVSGASSELSGGASREAANGASRGGAGDAAGAAGNRTGATLRGVGIAARAPFRRLVGRLSPAEMTQYLKEVLANRPDLRRLMAARVTKGMYRLETIKLALKEFEQSQGWKVVEKTAAEMEAVTTKNNLVTLRAEIREVWINTERANRWDPDVFYRHVVHDLSAQALAGRGGLLGADALPFVGHEFTSGVTDGLALLERSITEGNLDWIVRTFGR